MPTIIRRCTVAELEAAPNLLEVLAAYAKESAMKELGAPDPQIATYRALEASGMFHPIAAWNGDLLMGFILPVVVVLPHYGVVAATVESFFVLQSARKQGVGLLLLRQAEETAKALGAKALLLSAPVTGALGRVLAAKHYRHSNDVFVKALT